MHECSTITDVHLLPLFIISNNQSLHLSTPPQRHPLQVGAMKQPSLEIPHKLFQADGIAFEMWREAVLLYMCSTLIWKLVHLQCRPLVNRGLFSTISPRDVERSTHWYSWDGNADVRQSSDSKPARCCDKGIIAIWRTSNQCRTSQRVVTLTDTCD